MRDEFKGFYGLQEDEYKKLWGEAVFVFDTNVLLSLYRYQETTTTQLIAVIEKLKERVWIPYHVALEYQRNRLDVIASQNNKFSEVRKVVSNGTSAIKNELDGLSLKKRHSTIEPDSFIQDINDAAEKFLSELARLEESHFSVVSEDQIRVRLDELFKGRIGGKPKDQDTVNVLEKTAEARFKSKVPPGYMDDDKEKSGEPIFSYGDLSYQRKYSDYIVWSQILDHAKDNEITNLIFVTDDSKEDWWLKVKQNGEKTISPRPELIGEIAEHAGVERFHMYSSENFLKYANELLIAEVSEAAIEEVRDVARTRNKEHVQLTSLHESTFVLEKAVLDWVTMRYPVVNVEIGTNEPVDFVVTSRGKEIAFCVKVVLSPIQALGWLSRSIDRINVSENYDELIVVFVVNAFDDAESLEILLTEKYGISLYKKIIIGTVDSGEEGRGALEFEPYFIFPGFLSPSEF
ncbi:PIN domain-containing protein [Microbulbifer variabilis]|uniref:PIN domain-containing protein n=1 Tax=Microbulbifer variabilis TaxID=266805 RepID=UPI001CFE00BD|nr:PIN domain-containing protein [Microbulbifer variabilis]